MRSKSARLYRYTVVWVTANIIGDLPLDKQVEIGAKGNLPVHCSANCAMEAGLRSDGRGHEEAVLHTDAPPPAITLLLLCQGLLDGGDHLRRIGCHVRFEACHDVAIAIE